MTKVLNESQFDFSVTDNEDGTVTIKLMMGGNMIIDVTMNKAAFLDEL